MKNVSIWNNNYKNNIKSNYDIKNVDIVIIGAGITGSTLAYLLANTDKSVLLLDMNNINSSTTCKSSAKISYIQKDIYQKLYKYYNYNISKAYFDSQIEATNLLTEIIEKEKIKCDLQRCNSYLFSEKNENNDIVDKEMHILKKFGVTCYKANSLPIEFPVTNAFYVRDTYTFNPKKYLDGINNIIHNKINIWKNTIAFNIIKNYNNNNLLVQTSKGNIVAKKVVITNHYPFFIFPNLIPFRNYIKREYVCAGNYIFKNKFCAINVDDNLESIRFYKNYLIYVSNSHRLNCISNINKKYQQSQLDFKNRFYKDVDYCWMNQDLMTNDFLPIIGYTDKNNKDILLATGYNGWGMTNGVIAAKILFDLINNKRTKYKNLFSPQRINPIGIINSIVDGAYSTRSYIASYFNKENNVYSIKINGDKYLVYNDSNGKKHYIKSRCPHMKCNLIFNKEELTWDCPCHGSRFDIDGNLILGPAKDNISK